MIFFSALIVAVASAKPVPHAAAAPVLHSQAAPADGYFGRTKLSALGIRNEINLLARRYRERTIEDADLMHDADLAEIALDEWESAYPRDPWMAPTLFHLEQLYAEVQTPEARTHATALLRAIADRYGSSKEAHLSRLRLAQGLPALHAETQTHATPNPDGSGAAYATSASAAPTAASGATDAAPSAPPRGATPVARPSSSPNP